MGEKLMPLKACPFCGEQEFIGLPVNGTGYDSSGEVECCGCGARGPIRDAAGQRADAKERWNTRAPTASMPGREQIARQLYAWMPHVLEASIGVAGPGSFECATWEQLAGVVQANFLAKADAILALRPAGEGVIVVPINPTDAMLDAVAPWPKHWPKDGPDYAIRFAAYMTDRLAAASSWRSMVDAAKDAALSPTQRSPEPAAGEAGNAREGGVSAAIDDITYAGAGFDD